MNDRVARSMIGLVSSVVVIAVGFLLVAAKALGLTIPQSVLVRADEVIQ